MIKDPKPGQIGWTLPPDGSHMPVQVAYIVDGNCDPDGRNFITRTPSRMPSHVSTCGCEWIDETGTTIPAARVYSTPAEVMRSIDLFSLKRKPPRRKTRRAATTHAARTAPKDDDK